MYCAVFREFFGITFSEEQLVTWFLLRYQSDVLLFPGTAIKTNVVSSTFNNSTKTNIMFKFFVIITVQTSCQ